MKTLLALSVLLAPLPASASRYLYLEQYSFDGDTGDAAFVSAAPLGGSAVPQIVPTLVCFANGAPCGQAEVVSPEPDLFQVHLSDSLTWGYRSEDRTTPGDGGNPGVEPGVYTRADLAKLTLISLRPTDVVYAFQYDFDGRSSGFVLINDGYLPASADWTAVTPALCFVDSLSCGVTDYVTPEAGLLQVQASLGDEVWGFRTSDGVGNPIDTPGTYTRGSFASLTVIGSDAAGVPEPAPWVIMTLGFGLLGGGLRGGSRNRRLTTARDRLEVSGGLPTGTL